MSAMADRLRDFTVRLLERREVLVDWPESADGLAILPAQVARTLHTAETLRLTTESASATDVLSANLASDFMERVGPLVHGEPNAAFLRLDGLYLKKSAMDEPVARHFAFPNARVRVREARPARMEYHCWHFSAAIDSEDRWEEIISFQLNAATGARAELPDPLGLMEAVPNDEARCDPPPDVERARRTAGRVAAAQASPFLARLEARLDRDRRRIRGYYDALLDEAGPAHARLRVDPGKIEEKRRAVDLELRRKLIELDERYSLHLSLEPIALIALNMPVLEVELDVSRRPAAGGLRVYWNPLRKELEPVACRECGINITSIHFNRGLEPVCAACCNRSE